MAVAARVVPCRGSWRATARRRAFVETTTQSHANRDFPWFDEYPRFCGAQSRLAVSAGKKDRFRGSSGPSVSGNPKTVSPERGKERSETRFACDRDRFCKVGQSG